MAWWREFCATRRQSSRASAKAWFANKEKLIKVVELEKAANHANEEANFAAEVATAEVDSAEAEALDARVSLLAR